MKKLLNNLRFILQVFLVCFVTNISAQTAGCTDDLANNFNPNATLNDGSCTYDSTGVSPINSWLLPEVLNETSGLILWNNKIVTHNDDTDINLYFLDTSDINNYSTYPLTSCVNNDWEAISQDSTYIYIGDFGNNVGGNRINLKILRVDKASLLQNSPIIDTINFSYSLQTDFSPMGNNNTDFDCEAFVVSTDSIYLFTKEWVSKRSTIYALPKTPGTYSADLISSYNVQGLITGATYLEEKRIIALSGYSPILQPFIVLLYDFHNSNFFSGNKRKITLDLPLTQVEGIATKDGLNYFISNEKFTYSTISTPAKLNLVNLSNYLEDYLVLNTLNPTTIEKIEIYPNPVTELINIKMKSSDLSAIQLTIFNSLGQMLHSYHIISDESTIDVSSYNKGFYYYVITSKGKFIMREKIIKQ